MATAVRRLLALLFCLAVLPFNALGEKAPTPAVEIPSDLAVEGFFASAFSPEYGDTDRNVMIRWAEPLHVFMEGSATEEDRRAFSELLEELRTHVPNLPEISLAEKEEDANVMFSFVPLHEMDEFVTGYVPGNWGFMNSFHDKAVIRYGQVAVVNDKTKQEDRNHLIREEFVNMLGLCGDIDFAPESIIYQPYTTTQTLAAIDYEMLNLLYSPLLTPGMTAQEAEEALEPLFREE
jgi:hypothetical protein